MQPDVVKAEILVLLRSVLSWIEVRISVWSCCQAGMIIWLLLRAWIFFFTLLLKSVWYVQVFLYLFLNHEGIARNIWGETSSSCCVVENYLRIQLQPCKPSQEMKFFFSLSQQCSVFLYHIVSFPKTYGRQIQQQSCVSWNNLYSEVSQLCKQDDDFELWCLWDRELPLLHA